MIEQAVLSSISLNGLDIASEINRPMEVNLFKETFPNLIPEKEKEPFLYIPQIYNFGVVDGVIVWKEFD